MREGCGAPTEHLGMLGGGRGEVQERAQQRRGWARGTGGSCVVTLSSPGVAAAAVWTGVLVWQLMP